MRMFRMFVLMPNKELDYEVDKSNKPKWYQPVLCLLENRCEETRYPLMCHMNVHNEWLDMYGNKIDEQSVSIRYWAEVPNWPLDNVVPCGVSDEDIDS